MIKGVLRNKAGTCAAAAVGEPDKKKKVTIELIDEREFTLVWTVGRPMCMACWKCCFGRQAY